MTGSYKVSERETARRVRTSLTMDNRSWAHKEQLSSNLGCSLWLYGRRGREGSGLVSWLDLTRKFAYTLKVQLMHLSGLCMQGERLLIEPRDCGIKDHFLHACV